jgi:hypothetical protein
MYTNKQFRTQAALRSLRAILNLFCLFTHLVYSSLKNCTYKLHGITIITFQYHIGMLKRKVHRCIFSIKKILLTLLHRVENVYVF